MKHAWLVAALACAVGCHKTAPVDPLPAAAMAAVSDAVKEQAFKDLQSDILTLKLQLAVVTALSQAKPPMPAPQRTAQVKAPLYTCERLAIAGRELADDARAQSFLGEADALCAYQAPLAAGELELASLETARGAEPPPKSAPSDCGPIRDALNRIGAKYKNDPKLAALIVRFKTDCPRMRLGATAHTDRPSSGGSSSPGPDPRAQRDACKKRCDDASFDCRSRCQYCGSCTTDKTWEWCNATCNNCKSGCEQNERFCQSACGS